MRNLTDDEKNRIKEEIKDILSDTKARDTMEIIKTLGYGSELDTEIIKILNEMTIEYDLYITKKNKYLNFKDSDFSKNIYKGIFMSTKSEFGFVRVNELNEDIFIPGKKKSTAMDGDLVLVKVINGETDTKHCEGEILKVLKTSRNNILAEVIIDNNKYYCTIKNNKKLEKIELIGDNLERLVDGNLITVELLDNSKVKAKLKKIIGHKNDPDIDIVAVLTEHDFDVDFSSESLKQLETIPTEVKESDILGRVDLRDEMIFTIDGDDTKDIDDAISCKKLPNGHFELGVHIANVPYYIKEGSPLDLDARTRGTSVYLADRVVPMYPHQISNGICSLNPGVDRLTISSIMEIDEKGNLVDYKIVPSVINSRIQMTYNKVNEILEKNIIPDMYEPYVEKLKEMKKLADIVRQNKINRGYIDFEIDEAKIIQDDTGKAIDVIKRTREEGEMLIEDFMIAANETVANHIYQMDLPFIYRVHDVPKTEKIEEFMNLVKILGYKINHRITDFNPKSIQGILNDLSDKPEFPILSSLLLRSMKKAEYNTDNIGHYGLSSKAYTHFTSPIRRYPDLQVHRLLRKYLFEHDLSMTTIKNFSNSLVTIAEHSSEREVAAVNAERDVLDMKMAEYMEEHIGQEYDGIITTITNFGFFVELPNLIEGLVHVQTLKGDYYNYIPELLSMIGKSTKKTYRLGDKVHVKCVAASKETANIDFEIMEVLDNGDKKQKS